ncbi:hypothetical protein [Jannaschia seohaensis]|uniref:Uncharacterized protein n=1 Tax=Jannaschia seohaensis TaxID=475081 RepID=A0A2Y9A074_9RHOB|nr:hypothetical protein [Jannaschia seohaensis]PWJ21673.1 hypothetical protein BCF38_10179 [Jannaschia seohaensis]SSA37951.1 hypothetical protein SAMN05421539_10179 [Jannaschia seohaensis]
MAEPAERGAAAERMAAVAIFLGIGAVIAGMGLLGIGAMTGGLPGLPSLGWLGALLPGAVVALLGLSLVMRGMHLNATLDTLANIRLLQEETHRARTQAAVHSHAVREPLPELRTTSQMQMAQAASNPAPKVTAKVTSGPGSATVAHMPKRASIQTEQRASKSAPIKGKPFQPHPIFMARPPK